MVGAAGGGGDQQRKIIKGRDLCLRRKKPKLMGEKYRWKLLSMITEGLLEAVTFITSQVNRSRMSYRLREEQSP